MSCADAELETGQAEDVLTGQDTWLFELKQTNCTTNAKPLEKRHHIKVSQVKLMMLFRMIKIYLCFYFFLCLLKNL